jgi:5-methylcytosine-specific restriction endonuclease McrA
MISLPEDAPSTQNDSSQTKICSKCGNEKPLTEFNFRNKQKGVRHSRCKACASDDSSTQWRADIEKSRDTDRRRRQAKLEQYRERQRIRDSTPERKAQKAAYRAANAERRKANAAAYRKAKAESISVYNKQYQLDHPELYREATRNWQRRNPGKIKATKARASHRRRARESQSVNDLTAGQWQEIIDLQNNRCAMCRTQFGLFEKPTRDHVVPLSKGGGLTASNVQALCSRCNSTKRDKTIDLRPSRRKKMKAK